LFYKETQQIPCYAVKVDCAVPALRLLLEKMLSQWGISPKLPQDKTLQVQASPEKQSLCLTPPGGPKETLPFPIRTEELWLALQPHLYDPPRQHFRVPMRIRGRLQQTETPEPFLSVSLSDAGVRCEFSRELPRDSKVTLVIPLGAKSVTLLGKVIYSVPTRASDSVITGIVFTPHQEETRTLLREFLVEQTLRHVAQQINREPFLEALAYFALPDYIRTRLQNPL